MSVWKKWIAALLVSGSFLSATTQLLGVANSAVTKSGIFAEGKGSGGSCT